MVLRHDPARRWCSGDNYSGVHPAVMAALSEANGGHTPAYGADPYTAALQERIRDVFAAPEAVALPVFGGTGANVLSLAMLTHGWGAVVCSTEAHVLTDEGGAPEHHGIKLLPVPATDGRLDPADLAGQVSRGVWFRAQATALSVAQSTELGTIYAPGALTEIGAEAHRLGLAVHLDGARIFNAAARLELPLADLTTECEVDVVSLGLTKCGAMFGEVVVILDPAAVDGAQTLRKRLAQMPSKARFVSAQALALLGEDSAGELGRQIATHSNAMADALAAGLTQIEGVTLSYPVESNAVFVRMPGAAADLLAAVMPVAEWTRDNAGAVVRFMGTFDTTADDVERTVNAVAAAVGQVQAV